MSLGSLLLRAGANQSTAGDFTAEFEAGYLRAWTTTGAAFDSPPTRGDNPTTRGRGPWEVSASTDNANGALIIQVAGAAPTTVGWVATVRTAEVINQEIQPAH